MDYMLYALSLARKALGTTSPNPAVGAVIVKDGVIVGEGYTQPPGLAHAEVVALKQAGEGARGASLFVTLEPCCHWGRTPPCTGALIEAGLAEVHLATLDPNPLVSGRGREGLERAGIKTFLGEHEEEVREVNEAYIKFITTGLPFVVAKFAMSLDGKIATRAGDSKWISGEVSRDYVQSLRRTADAVMVGVNTVLLDDPQLTVRGGQRTPLRVIVDSRGRAPLEAKVFRGPGKALLAVAIPLAPARAKRFASLGVEVVRLPSKGGLVDLKELLKVLGGRQITSVLVEGGGTLLGSLFDQGLVDKVLAFVAPLIIGGEKAKTAVGGEGVERVSQALRLAKVRVERFGEDLLVSGYVRGSVEKG